MNRKFMNHAHVGDYMDVDAGLRMHYLRQGQGKPLVLIHSYGQSLYTWRNNFFALSQAYDVIALDLMGCGYSDCPHKGYTIAQQAHAIDALVNELGLENVYLLGFSLGGVIALEYIEQHPGRVPQAMILSPGAMTQTMPKYVRMLDSSLFSGAYLKMLNLNTTQELLYLVLFDRTATGEEHLQGYYAPFRNPGTRKALGQNLRRFDERPTMDALHLIQSEILLARGSEDTWHTQQDMQLYHGAIRGSAAMVIRNAGHLAHEEKWDKVNQLILEFFER